MDANYELLDALASGLTRELYNRVHDYIAQLERERDEAMTEVADHVGALDALIAENKELNDELAALRAQPCRGEHKATQKMLNATTFLGGVPRLVRAIIYEKMERARVAGKVEETKG